MANDKKIFTLHPDNNGEKGHEILTHGADDLANREAAAKRDGRNYTISEVSK